VNGNIRLSHLRSCWLFRFSVSLLRCSRSDCDEGYSRARAGFSLTDGVTALNTTNTLLRLFPLTTQWRSVVVVGLLVWMAYGSACPLDLVFDGFSAAR
jgi:hypothetical protein